MTTREQAFPSRYLKASDLSKGPVTLEIKNAQLESLVGFDGRQEQKTVLYFHNASKRLPLNKTNFFAVCDATNEEDSDRWPGKKIEVFTDTTTMSGKTYPCVRIRSPMVRPAASRPLAKTDAATARRDAASELDDENPF